MWGHKQCGSGVRTVRTVNAQFNNTMSVLSVPDLHSDMPAVKLTHFCPEFQNGDINYGIRRQAG